MQNTFQISHLIGHFELLSIQGVRLPAMIAGAGITVENAMNPSHHINFDQQEILLNNICRLNDDPLQGFKAGLKRNPACFGIAMQAVLSSKNLIEANKKAQHLEPIYAPYLQHKTQPYEYRDNSYVGTNKYTATLAHSKEIITETSLTICKTLSESMLGKQPKLKLIRLGYKKPANHNAYEKFFKCPVEFNSDHTEIWLDAELARTPSILWNETFSNYAEKIAITQKENSVELLEFIETVSLAINRHPVRYPSLNQVADQLCMSQRTLHRKLEKCSTSYQKIIDRIKLNHAERYILHTHLSIEEISAEIGFASSNSFRVAFKNWTNLSPTEFRRKNKKTNMNNSAEHEFA